MSRSLQTAIQGLQQRSARARFLSAWLGAAVPGLWVAAAGLLILRQVFARGEFAEWVQRAPWLLAVAVLGTGLWAWRQTRRGLSAEGAATWLDVATGSTGRLVAGFERPDPRWSATVQEALAQLPETTLRLRLKPLIAPLAFALVAWLLPQPSRPPVVPPGVFERRLEQAQQALEGLQEEVALEATEQERFEERLERLEEEAKESTQPQSTFEAIERLSDDLAERAREAAEHVDQARSELAAAGSLPSEQQMERVQEALAELDQADLMEGEWSQLAEELTQELDAKLAELAALSPHEMEMGGESLALDPSQLAQLAKLSQELQKQLGAEAGNLAKLAKLDLSKLQASSGKLDLAEFEPHICGPDCGKPGGT